MSVRQMTMRCVQFTNLLAAAICVFVPATHGAEASELGNAAYHITVESTTEATDGRRQVAIALDDNQMGFRMAEGPYFYRAVRRDGAQSTTQFGLDDVSAQIEGSRMTIQGKLAGLDVEHIFDLPADRPIMEERIVLHNHTGSRIEISDFEAALVRTLTDKAGQVLPELANDRWVALPFRCHLDQVRPNYDDFSTADLVNSKGQKLWVKVDQQCEYVPTDHRQADGWAWTHGPHTLGIFKFDQENMQWSILAADKVDAGTALRFGGAWTIDGEPSALSRIEPGQTVRLGVTRYQTVPGGHDHAMYALRKFLDENGCRFPMGFNPPVHWEQLYDMEGAWDDRPKKYTKAILEKEAAKGVEYNCEALYLDPGWDTDFATWLWGEKWLGPRNAFVEEMQSKYGLKVSLHTPLAWWMSNGRGWNFGGDTAPSTYPPEARRKAPSIPGSNPPAPWGTSTICMGSKAYLDEAARRLLEHCADGVAFLMFDGSQYQGGCEDRTHGHPVPFTREDHMRACLELTRRVHAKYPAVLIEMHDMLGSGVPKRNIPVYYKYGLPGSYDSVWASELMWQPMEHIHTGRARGLYYYKLACNVPIYLHIDLRKDNEHCLELWWYASTCRHLGIGGTHQNPAVVAAQKAAMRRYRELDRFFKRGEFFGISEEIHLHALLEENAFVANLFNLSDEKRVVGGTIELGQMGLKGERLASTPEYAGALEKGIWTVQREMAPWSAQVIHVQVRH